MSLAISLQSGAVVFKNGFPSCACCGESVCPAADSDASSDDASCRYTFDLSGPQNCYSPNQFRNRFTEAFSIGPLKLNYSLKVLDAEVDDDLEINGQIIQPGQHLVDLGAGSTCNGTSFSGGRSAFNGRHKLSNVEVGDFGPDFGSTLIFIRGVDHHGIDLFARGTVELTLISTAP